MQGFIIIRDSDSILSKVLDLAPKYLWNVTAMRSLQHEENVSESVVIYQKKFWAIVWGSTQLDLYKLNHQENFLYLS